MTFELPHSGLDLVVIVLVAEGEALLKNNFCKQRRVEDALVCHGHGCCESCVLRCFFSNVSSTPTTSFLVLHQSEDPFLTRCVSIWVLEVFSKRCVAWSFLRQRDGEAPRLSFAA